MKITTVINEKEIIDLNKNELIFIRGRVFKKVNISRRGCHVCHVVFMRLLQIVTNTIVI